jgi:6-phospho-3-hexuloisomerase
MDGDALLADLSRVLKSIDPGELEALMQAILDAGAIHLAGVGRSGLVARAFGSRLSQAGFRVHTVGGVMAPAFHSEDLLIVCSGSGSAESMVLVAQRAVAVGGRVALVSATPISPLARIAHHKLLVPPVLPADSPVQVIDPRNAGLMQPLRVLFDQAALILFDAMIPRLAAATGQGPEDLESRRRNLL